MQGQISSLLLLLPACMCFVAVQQGLNDIYLSPLETAFLDISQVFAGQFLDFEVRADASHDVAIDYNLKFTEITVDSRIQGEIHFGNTDLDYIPLYSNRKIEVWKFAGTVPKLAKEISTQRDVEGVVTRIYRDDCIVFYWTKQDSDGSLYFESQGLLDDYSTPIKGITAAAESKVIPCSQESQLYLFQFPNSSSSFSSFHLHQETRRADKDLTSFNSYPFHPIDIHCSNALTFLSPTALYKANALVISLRRASVVSGQLLRLHRADFWDFVFIEAEKGMLVAAGARKVIFVRGGKFAFRLNYQEFGVLVLSGDKWLFSYHYLSDSVQRSFMIPLNLSEKAEDIASFQSLHRNRAQNQHYFLFLTKQGIKGYLFDYLSKLSLRVVGEAGNFDFELCAFNYFDRSENACITVHIRLSTPTILLHGSPITNTTAIQLPCEVTGSPQICKYDISDWFSDPSIHLTVRNPDTDMSVSAVLPSKLQQYDFSFTVPDIDLRVGCCEYDHATGANLVFLGFNRIVISNSVTGENREMKTNDEVDFLDCEILGEYVLLYGVTNNLSGALYRASIVIEKSEIIGFQAIPKLIRASFNLVAAVSNQILIFFVGPNSFRLFLNLTVDAEILDISFSQPSLLVLTKGRIFSYDFTNMDFLYPAAYSINPKENSLSHSGDRILTLDSSGTVSAYLLHPDLTTTLLYSLNESCQSLDVQVISSEMLLICANGVKTASMEDGPHSWTNILQLEQGRKVTYWSSSRISFAIVACKGENCIGVAISNTVEDERYLSLAFSPESSQFQVRSRSHQFSLILPSQEVVLLNVTLRNSGTFIIPNRSCSEETVSVAWDEVLEVPLFHLFSGNGLIVRVNTTPPSDDISIVPAYSLHSTLDLSDLCARDYSVVADINLVVCYSLHAIQFYRFTCQNQHCKYTLKGEYENSEQLQMTNFVFICRVNNTVVMYFTVMRFSNNLVRPAGIFLCFDYERKSIKALEFLKLGIRDIDTHAVAESSLIIHFFVYGLYLQHFILSFEGHINITQSEKIAESHLLMNIVSIASYRNDSNLLLNVLDADNRLLTFSLRGNEVFLGSYQLSIRSEPDRITLLHGSHLYHFQESSILILSLPSYRILTSISLPRNSTNTRLNWQSISFSESQQPLLAVPLEAGNTLIIDTSAPQYSNIICSLPYKNVQFNGDYLVGLRKLSFDLLTISVPALCISADDSQSREVVRRVTVTANSECSGPVSVSFFIHRYGKSHWEIALVFGLGVAGMLWIAKKRGWVGRNNRVQREVELETLQRE